MAIFWGYIYAFLPALLFGLVLTPLVRAYAVGKDIVARPRRDRWHCKPTALLGGISIFVSYVFAWLFVFFLSGQNRAALFPMIPLMLSGTGLFFLGLADDVFEVNPQYKLVGQVIVASVMVFLGFHIDWFPFATANILLSIIWIVGITNAFNLLDNMDGLCAGVAIIAAFFLFIWVLMNPSGPGNSAGLLLMIAIYAGSILGFLIYNFYPASIFMGDAGSMFIGFMLAGLTMMAGSSAAQEMTGGFGQLAVVLMPVLILFVPIMDTALVSFTRRLSRRSIFQGGQDHCSHRMVAIGFSEKKAVLLLYVFAVISGMLAIVLIPTRISVSMAIVFIYLLLVVLLWTYLASLDVYSRINQQDCSGLRCEKIEPDINPHIMSLLAMGFDILLITTAYYAAYLLRFEGDMGPNFDFFARSLPVLYACQIAAFYLSGFYQRTWWSSRLGDIAGYAKGVTAGTVAAILVLLFLYRFQSFSRAVFVIYWGLILIMVTFSRSFLKVVDEAVHRKNPAGRPALIWGAGKGGQLLAREIENNPGLGMCLKGYMDDNPRLAGRKIHGYPVFGGMQDLEKIIETHGIREIVISFKENSQGKKKEITRACSAAGHLVSVRSMEIVLS